MLRYQLTQILFRIIEIFYMNFVRKIRENNPVLSKWQNSRIISAETVVFTQDCSFACCFFLFAFFFVKDDLLVSRCVFSRWGSTI